MVLSRLPVPYCDSTGAWDCVIDVGLVILLPGRVELTRDFTNWYLGRRTRDPSSLTKGRGGGRGGLMVLRLVGVAVENGDGVGLLKTWR